MKGLFYFAAKMNRGFLIAAAVTFLCSAVVGSIVLSVPNIREVFGFVVVWFLPLIPIMIVCEFPDRHIEKDMKLGFLNYTLSSMARTKYILSQLIVNLSCVLLGTAMGYALLGIFRTVAGKAVVHDEYFILFALIAILVGVIEWVVMPLTLVMKSAEKASLLVGLVLGFAFVLPINIILKSLKQEFDVVGLADVKVLLITLAAAVAIYAIVYAIINKVLKKGV